ncbi:MAG: alanine racemase [Calditrichaeota bacterium]|jgi:alanine racemase|nr:alanine racemase [Calditrichota bacterium]MBT7617432.1 alanine racemase [Calditrichota bacterium]MBT7790490.1 alanine racemase [Calditrichota bacterium]
MKSPSVIELSKSALKKNLRFLRKLIGKETIFSSVIKGNAYGHGIEVFVPLAEACGVRHFSLFDASEALRTLNSRTCKSDIMIMGAIDNDELEWAIENDISFYIFNRDRLINALDISKRIGKPTRVHLELETGLNRMGLIEKDLEDVIKIIMDEKEHFKIEGVSTHFAGAESVNNYLRIQNQIDKFKIMTNNLRRENAGIGFRHAACSAAVFNYPETIMDMVRVGIAQYGFWPNKETQLRYVLANSNDAMKKFNDPLKRVLKWKSRIIDVKHVKSGDFIGYGTSYQTSRAQKIASVPVGYFHGFSRNLSNYGRVLINGKRVAVVGLVNMNMMMVNVTDVPNVKIGDEVVIIGKQGRMQITIASFSDMTDNLNYEVLVSLQPDIPRIVVD